MAATWLMVAPNGRFLTTDAGRPFFYLSDTAWLLLYRLDRKESELYLKTRAKQGYTVIKVMGLEEFGELKTPNRYGDLPLLNLDPATPNPKFFDHVDWLLKIMKPLGLYLAFDCTWGDKVGPKLWGKGPVVFNEENAGAYGKWLGKRYAKTPNIIWLLGGDRPPVVNKEHFKDHDGPEDYRNIWDAMADGIKEGGAAKQLMSYHPMGGSSTGDHLHDEPWLDFNMMQSGHGERNSPNWRTIERDYARTPPKPCMDDEACYEDHAVNWKPENGWFDDYDVRKTAYWAVFAGAHGHTYGSSPIFCFSGAPGPALTQFGARRDWKEALQLPGSIQMGYLRQLMLSRPFVSRIPDQSMIAGDAGEGTHHVRATRDANGTYAFVYLPVGKEIEVRTEALKGKRLTVSWFDPRHGTTTKLGTIPNTGTVTASPPMPGPGVDWVLVLDARE